MSMSRGGIYSFMLRQSWLFVFTFSSPRLVLFNVSADLNFKDLVNSEKLGMFRSVENTKIRATGRYREKEIGSLKEVVMISHFHIFFSFSWSLHCRFSWTC